LRCLLLGPPFRLDDSQSQSQSPNININIENDADDDDDDDLPQVDITSVYSADNLVCRSSFMNRAHTTTATHETSAETAGFHGGCSLIELGEIDDEAYALDASSGVHWSPAELLVLAVKVHVVLLHRAAGGRDGDGC